MKAVILAGGRGTRLAPYTTAFPKPLVPIGEYPVIEVLIRRLAANGIRDITLTVGYLAELLRAYFTQHPTLTGQLNLTYATEEQPTGTAGSLASVPGLNETFLVMNGDVLTTLDFTKLVAHHRDAGAALTIATQQKRVKIDLGVLVTDEHQNVRGYHEKPEFDYQVSMGIYVYEPRVLRHIPVGEYLDFPDLVLKLIAAGERVVSYPSDDIWLDIGRHEDYENAVRVFECNRAAFLPDIKD